MTATFISDFQRYFFIDQPTEDSAWLNFSSKSEDMLKPISERPVDWSLKTPSETTKRKVVKVVIQLFKFVIFPIAVYELTKYILQRIAMSVLLPDQSKILKLFKRIRQSSSRIPSSDSVINLEVYRQRSHDSLTANRYLSKRIIFEKDGKRFDGFLVGHQNNIRNRQWALHINEGQPLEHRLIPSDKEYISLPMFYSMTQFNVLMINPSSIGHSEHQGPLTFKKMAEAQELGLRFIEEVIDADKIMITGRNIIGGGVMSELIKRHEFNRDRHYIALFDRTFDRLSHLASKITGLAILEKILQWIGLEINVTNACKKILSLGHTAIVLQTSVKMDKGPFLKEETIATDGIIPKEDSLAYRLAKSTDIDRSKLYVEGIGKVEHSSLFQINYSKDTLKIVLSSFEMTSSEEEVIEEPADDEVVEFFEDEEALSEEGGSVGEEYAVSTEEE